VDEKFDVCLIAYTNPVRNFLPAFRTIPMRIGHRRFTDSHFQPTHPLQWIQNRLRLDLWEEEWYRKILLTHPVDIHVADSRDHDIDKNLRMLQPLGLARESLSRDVALDVPAAAGPFAMEFLKKAGLPPNTELIGASLGVSGGMDWKKWDLRLTAELLARLCERTGSHLLLVGSAADRPLEQEFKKHFLKPFVSAVGQTSVWQMAALLQRCSLFVSNDSGPSKLSIALNVPTAIIWGPSDRGGAGPWKTGPFVTIRHEVPCSPCYTVGLTKRGEGVLNHFNCGHRDCLNRLSVDEAEARIHESLPFLLHGR